MTTLAQQYPRVKAPANSSTNDQYTATGVRVSLPMYLDLPQQLRKEILNGIRNAIHTEAPVKTPGSISGIRTQEAGTTQHAIEAYLGMSIDVLRNVLFTRGGQPIDMILRLQSVSGVEVITEKELKAVIKQREKFCVDYLKNETYKP